MTTRSSRSGLLVGALCALLAAGYLACSDSTAPRPRVALGPTTSIAGGTGHTYVALDGSGMPTEVGVRFSASVLTTLPSGTAMADYTFDLPAEASSTPYTHVVIGWNPVGHPPAVYQTPHFDVHFYQISSAARDAIVPSDPDFNAKMAKRPADALIPASYILTPGGVPRMGAHWVDATAPELNGQPFTSTFIYGSYNGAFIFVEPMVAKAFLETRPTFTSAIKLPSQYATPGNYPTSYTVAYDAATMEYRVALGGFVRR
ncbi:MAG: DUF5602 domain-containing protein [Gemmatimonadaceae bacterium]